MFRACRPESCGMHHIRTHGPDHPGQGPINRRELPPCLSWQIIRAGRRSRVSESFFSAQADDDMFDIIGPVIDQGGNPIFQPPDPEGINNVNNPFHFATRDKMSAIRLTVFNWQVISHLFYGFFKIPVIIFMRADHD